MGNSPVLAQTSWIVRYRFDGRGALERHLRFGGGFFFVPGPTLPGGPGARVAVELQFLDSDEAPLVHGRIVSRLRDGVWLDAPLARAASRWAPGPDSPRRVHRRLACDLFVEVKPRDAAPWLCRALDVSEAGLRLGTGSFETGVAGDDVEMTVLSPDGDLPPIDVRGRLCWSGAREAGLTLLSPPSGMADLMAVVESRWVALHEVEHASDCRCSSPIARSA